MTDIKKGDRVKVTTEVEILSPEAVRVNTLGNGAVYGYRALFKGVAVVVPADATIEKIEPPVEVFKPGDVVRFKPGQANDGSLRALTPDGYVILGDGSFFPYTESIAIARNDFTSDRFEKVDLG